MYVKPTQKFRSPASGATIKVTKVIRSSVSNIYDVCRISNLSPKGRVDRSTARYVYADSIRRRYYQVS